MKRIILFCVLLLMMSTMAYAAPGQEETDARALLNDYKDLSYKLEVGLAYNKFVDAYTDLYAKERRFEDTYPNSEMLPEAKAVLEPYGDAKDLWTTTLTFKTPELRWMAVTPQNKKRLKILYPNIDKDTKHIYPTTSTGLSYGTQWDIDSLISVLFNYGKERSKLFEDKINQAYQTAE